MADKTSLSGVLLPTDATQPGEAVRRSQVVIPVLFGARQTTTVSLTAAAFTPLALQTEDVDTADGHSTTNPSRYTAKVAGWYWVSGGANTNGTTGNRAANINRNGTEVPGCSSWVGANPAGETRLPTRSRLIYLAVNDYVEVVAYASVACSTTAGSSLDLTLAMAA